MLTNVSLLLSICKVGNDKGYSVAIIFVKICDCLKSEEEHLRCIRVELQMGVLLKKGKHVFNLDWNCILKVNKNGISGKGHFLSRKGN